MPCPAHCPLHTRVLLQDVFQTCKLPVHQTTDVCVWAVSGPNLGSFLSLQAGQVQALQTVGSSPTSCYLFSLSLPLLQELGGVRNEKYLQKSIRSHSPTASLRQGS